MRLEDYSSQEFGSIKHTFGPEGPYSAFVPASLPNVLPLSSDVVLALSRADDALGRLAGAGRLLPNPQLLINPYVTREALSSSRIEGTQASLSEIFEADVNDVSTHSVDVREVQNYKRALARGIEMLGEVPISTRMIREVHAVLMRDVRGGERQPGEFRDGQNWIGQASTKLHDAVFVPPPVDEMKKALADWERFANNNSSIPTLIQAALLHYQFETIHPFFDGNGRLGRLLVVLFLMNKGRMSQPLLYVSHYMEQKRDEYYSHLQAVRQRGEIQDWFLFFCDAVEVQARDAVVRAEKLIDLREEYRARLIQSRTRVQEVIDLAFINPVLTTSRIKKTLKMTTPPALKMLRQLEDAGVLVETTDPYSERGSRKYWLAPQILSIIETDI